MEQREQQVAQALHHTVQQTNLLETESAARKEEISDLENKKQELLRAISEHSGAMTSEQQALLAQQESLNEQKKQLEIKEQETLRVLQGLQEQAHLQTSQQRQLEAERQAITAGQEAIRAKEVELNKKQDDLDRGVFTTNSANVVGKKRRVVETPNDPTPSFGPPNIAHTNQWLERGNEAADNVIVEQEDEMPSEDVLAIEGGTDVADDLSAS